MAASGSDWNEAVAYWSRVGELGVEAALREAGCSEQRIVETLTLLNSSPFSIMFHLHSLDRLTDPEMGRAEVLATLGRDNVSPIQMIYSSDGVWGRVCAMSKHEAAALCVNLSSNNEIKSLTLNNCEVFGTVEGCMLLGNALATNSLVHSLYLANVGMGSDGVRYLLRGLHSSKTLNTLVLAGNPLLDEGIACVAEFLMNNATIKVLNLRDTCCSQEGAKRMSSVLVNNTRLERLHLGVESVGREGMKTLLQPLSVDEEDAMNSRIPKNNSLKLLGLFHPNRESVEPLSHMIRTNKSLSYLELRGFAHVTGNTYLAPFLPEDWTEKVFPALKENDTLLELCLDGSDGLVGEEVYESVMDLLQNSNTKLEKLEVGVTGLKSRHGQICEELRINKEYRSRLRGQPRPLPLVVLYCADMGLQVKQKFPRP